MDFENHLPLWIADTWIESVSVSETPMGRVDKQLEVVEGVLELLSLRIIATLLANPQLATDKGQEKIARAAFQCFGKRSALGDWVQLVDAGFKAGGPLSLAFAGVEAPPVFPSSSPVADVLEFLTGRRKTPSITNFFEGVAHFRNDSGHRRKEPSRLVGLAPLLADSLRLVVESLPGLTTRPFCHVAQVRDEASGKVIIYRHLKGSGRRPEAQHVILGTGASQGWCGNSLVLWDGSAMDPTAVPAWLARYDSHSHVLQLLQGTDNRKVQFHSRQPHGVHTEDAECFQALWDGLAKIGVVQGQVRVSPARVYQEAYRRALENDGVVTSDEWDVLNEIAEGFGLGSETRDKLHKEVRESSPPAPVPERDVPLAEPAAHSEPARLCPECRSPASTTTDRTCPTHGLYLVGESAIAKLSDAPLLGQVLDGKYALVDLIGGGGCGTVYRGLQQPLGRNVAVKVLLGTNPTGKEGLDRFEREAKALARLTSPHTVRLIDFGVTRDGPILVRNLPYMVMEVIEGADLDRRVREGALPPAEVVDLLEGIADSLGEAHAAGIVHRDLKPSNVLMTRSYTGRSIPKVIDFGIARVEGTDRTRTGVASGTPAYMAPEQIYGESNLDPRVDVYALAVMTFQLLTGQIPFSGRDVRAIFLQHDSAAVPSLRTLSTDPAVWRFDAIIAAGMAKKREQRPASVFAFVEGCKDALAGRTAPQVPETQPSLAPSTTPYVSPSESGGKSSEAPALPVAAAAPAKRGGRGTTALFSAGAAGGLAAVLLGWLALKTPRADTPDALPTVAVATPAPAFLASEAPTVAPAASLPALTALPTANGAQAAGSLPALPKTLPALAVTSPRSVAVAVSVPVAKPRQAAGRPVPGEDAPQSAGPDAATRQLAGEADRAIDECRCVAAARFVEEMAAAPQGQDLAAPRRAKVAACRPVDIDHRCVHSQLVEVE